MTKEKSKSEEAILSALYSAERWFRLNAKYYSKLERPELDDLKGMFGIMDDAIKIHKMGILEESKKERDENIDKTTPCSKRELHFDRNYKAWPIPKIKEEFKKDEKIDTSPERVQDSNLYTAQTKDGWWPTANFRWRYSEFFSIKILEQQFYKLIGCKNNVCTGIYYKWQEIPSIRTS